MMFWGWNRSSTRKLFFSKVTNLEDPKVKNEFGKVCLLIARIAMYQKSILSNFKMHLSHSGYCTFGLFIEETALVAASFVLDILNPARSFLFRVVVLWAEFIVALWLQPAASCFDGVDCVRVLTSWDWGERNATALDPLATVEVHPNHMMTYKIGEQGVPCKTWHSQAWQIQTR